MRKSFLLLFSIFITNTNGDKEICSSSCGGIQNISYPFRLKGDPDNCGDSVYELTCKNNDTFFNISSNRFLVTSISYEDSTISLVSVGAASGNCSQFDYLSASCGYNFPFQRNEIATFLNCSKETHNKMYKPLPCLSSNNSFVYVTIRSSIGDIVPFCSFLSMVPTSYDITSSHADVFQVLQKGFNFTWTMKTNKITLSKLVPLCLKKAKRYYAREDKSTTILAWFSYPFEIVWGTLNCLNSGVQISETGQYDPYSPYGPYGSYPGFIIVSSRDSFFVDIFDIVAFLSGIALLIRFVFVPIVMYTFLVHNIWKSLVPIDNIEKFLRMVETLTPSRYSYIDIIAMTSHFKEKLGHGGFGSVFKGELPGGFFVAVKILNSSKGNGDDFISEVSTIGSIRHHNVVKLVGFCSEGSKRALVYEFMPNGSLDKYIFSSNGTNIHFTKKKLNEIALGVARGIDYLHRGCEMRILHFDIKPHNILLDHSFNAKVSDFGLAKLYPKNHSLVSAFAARGTIGYMAPELVSRTFGQISYKSDVYSFGMLLMEMAGGRRNVDTGADSSSQIYYPSWVYDQIQERERQQILSSNEIEVDDIETKMCKVGLWCIQMRSSDRPDMSRVIEMLEADNDTLTLPPKPFGVSSVPTSLRESLVDSYTTELSTISETSDTLSLC